MLYLDDGTILTGTAPDAINSSVELCHETEPYCAAFRLGRSMVAWGACVRAGRSGGCSSALAGSVGSDWQYAWPQRARRSR